MASALANVIRMKIEHTSKNYMKQYIIFKNLSIARFFINKIAMQLYRAVCIWGLDAETELHASIAWP
jgi:hypothetical protein